MRKAELFMLSEDIARAYEQDGYVLVSGLFGGGEVDYRRVVGGG